MGFIRNFMQNFTIERLASAILFILLFAMAVRVPLDTDLWWHLRSGEYFLDEKRILQEDIYSFTQAGAEWINHGWGAQIIMAAAYRLTGGAGDVGDSGVIGLALYTAFFGTAGMFFVYRMCAGNIYSKAFVMVIGGATSAVFWSARPQMISFFLSALILYVLHLYKRQDRNYLWAIPLIMALWVNLHAGYAIGFIFLGGFIAGEVISLLLKAEDANRIGWQGLGMVGLATLAGWLVLALNPYGFRMWTYAFETASLQSLNLFIAEWMTPNFKQPHTWPFLLMLFGILTLASLTQKRLVWSDLILTIGTAFLALWAGRNIAVFAVATTPTLSRLADTYLSEKGWKIRPKKRVNRPQLILNWALLLLVLLGALGKIAADLNSENVQRLQAEAYPLAALDYLADNPPQGALLNHYNWGGLLIYLLPQTPVFVDGRTDLYGDDFLRAYFRSLLGASDWESVIEDYDIQTAFLPNESALTTLLRESEAWTLAYEDDQAAILERRTTEAAP